MSERSEAIQAMADEAVNDPAKLSNLVETLAAGTRRERQAAASAIYLVAKAQPDLLAGSIDALIDALNRPEAQTRWEALESLTLLIDLDARTCGKALADVETALFDEDSGPVRLGAMRFLCKFGATTALRSDKVWPLIDEGIQCYHGDLEFNDMLVALLEFSKGKLSDETRKAFAERMAFDATSGKGTLRKRARAIVDNLEG